MKNIFRYIYFLTTLLLTACTANNYQSFVSITTPSKIISRQPISSTDTPIPDTLTITITASPAPTGTSTPAPTLTITRKHQPEVAAHPLDPASFEVINRSNLDRIIAVSSYKPVKKITSDNRTDFAISPNGRTIAFIDEDHIDLWDLQKGHVTSTISFAPQFTDDFHFPYLLAFSPDGKKLAGITVLGPVLWDINTGIMLWGGKNDCNICDLEMFSSLSFTPDGKFILTSSTGAGSCMQLWSVLTGKMVNVIGGGGQPLDATFSPNGKILLSADHMDGTIYIWNPDTWKISGSIDGAFSVGLTFSPNGELLADALHGGLEFPEGISIYRVKDWKLLGEIREKMPPDFIVDDQITSKPTFNEDGEIICFGLDRFSPDRDDLREIAFWDALNQKKLLALDVYFPTIISETRFSRDGKFMIVRSRDGLVQFYGVPKK